VEAAGDTHAMVDRGQLGRAMRNLVTNAVQVSPPGGRVRIAVTDGASAQVRISDDGSGIADEDLPYIFERFYRADRSRGRRAGSGIGLTVARELVAANGGSVEVEATGPNGTTFLIRLPAGR
jgi:two-component system sensor histidine kinase BaeS